jgi:hypothetical protein
MSQFKFAQIPGNDTIASAVTLLVCAWFTAAGGAILAEPSVEQQARAAHRTPVVTVRQLAFMQEEQPAVRETIQVVASRGKVLASRSGAGVS